MGIKKKLKVQTTGAGRVGQCLHFAVVLGTATVKHNAVNPFGLGALGDQFTHLLGGIFVGTSRLVVAKFSSVVCTEARVCPAVSSITWAYT